METLPKALSALDAYPQFIAYKLVPKADRPDKMDKVPIDYRTGRMMPRGEDWQADPAYRADFATVQQAVSRFGSGHGVGYLFTPNDPFFFVDIDGCLEDNQWSALAQDLCRRFAGAAVEVSQSGTGLHIIGQATSVPPHGCRESSLNIELYHEGRFVALTGSGAAGDAGTRHDAALGTLIAQYFPPRVAGQAGGEGWTDGPVPEWNGPENDEELIAKACASRGAGALLGNRATFDDLWTADPDALGRAYPDDDKGRAYNASRADAALAAHLAFWTGCDCERIERLMWQSNLAREKWSQENHRTYLSRTIAGAVAGCDAVYTQGTPKAAAPSAPPPEPVEPEARPESAPEMVEGFQYLAATQQIEYFAGCVYVQDAHRVFTPTGALLRPEQFKATYGGYLFALDAANDKTTKNAWEAFVESQAVRYPIAESMTFRPERPSGEMVREDGRLLVNTYVPAKVDRQAGDATPFIEHMHKLLPEDRDRDILMAYMAACVQHAGVKFQWAPLLQGVEGNGKTLLTRCVARAVGMQYCHFPKADQVGNNFNAWVFRKLFIGIEDVYYPDHRREIIESLKPLITNDEQPIEAKGVDQINAHVCANFMLNSNHRDALRKTRNDRRFAIFYTAQQEKPDLARDGMGGDYFPAIYAWLRGGGYAIVADYLATYPIPDELNPATSCQRAPETSSTEQAISLGAGPVEQAILEAIDEGRIGFRGGWVSSMKLDQLLDDMRMARAIPHNKRRDLMRNVGYDWHPALRNGRVNNAVSIDNGKPRLFIREEHPDRAIASPAEVAHAYEAAQRGGSLAEQVLGG